MTTPQEHNTRADEDTLWPAARSEGFAAVFAWYVKRLLRKKFFAVRLSEASLQHLERANSAERPLLVLFTHSSWWDPLVGLFLASQFMPDRTGIAPMDTAQLRKFAFFRKLGIFGIDPENPASLIKMKEYVGAHFASHKRPSLFLTPQGQFADPRADLIIRPGAAAIAAGHKGCMVLAVSIEYGFWIDQKPEVFMHIGRVESEGESTTSWQRAIVRGMGETRGELASMVIARNPELFEVVLGGPASTNPVYDLYLRLMGKSNQISVDHRDLQRNTRRVKVGS